MKKAYAEVAPTGSEYTTSAEFAEKNGEEELARTDRSVCSTRRAEGLVGVGEWQ